MWTSGKCVSSSMWILDVSRNCALCVPSKDILYCVLCSVPIKRCTVYCVLCVPIKVNSKAIIPPCCPSTAPLFVRKSYCKDGRAIIHMHFNRGVYRQKVPCFTPNSFVMVNYKTFHLKHYIVFVKICPPTGQITFLARAQRKMA